MTNKLLNHVNHMLIRYPDETMVFGFVPEILLY
jgi:hypothetical protein